MSNDLIAFDTKTPMVRPAAFANLNPQEESLSDGIGASYGVIGYKGKVWSLRYKGETYYFVRPDDGSQIGYIDVVLLRQAPVKSKSFYPGGYVEGQSEGKRPICHSIDGVKPDMDAQARQAEACAICPKNVWRTTPDGRKGKECSDYKRLAALVLPAQTAKFFAGAGLIEPVFLRVPPASLNPLSVYGEALQAQGLHYAEVVTRISFDPTKATPQFQFRAIARIGEAEAPVVVQQRNDQNALRITGEDKTMNGQQLLTAAASHADPAAALAAPAMGDMATAGLATAPAVPAAVQPMVQQPAPQPVAQPVTPPAPTPAPTGFGLAEAAAMAAAPAKPPVDPAMSIGQTAADVGEPPAPNAEMDAFIAGLLKKHAQETGTTVG